MKIIALDDELIALKNLELKLKECVPDAEVHYFQKEQPLLDYLSTQKADVAFLDIRIGTTNGLVFAKTLREICPECAIIFLTGYSEYAVDAFRLKASGYLLKPVSTEDLRRELAYVKSNSQTQPIEKKLYVKCFGNFDLFFEGRPVTFSRSKSKELFAYLVDRRGSSASMPEIASALWDDGMYDHSRNNQIHTFLHDLIKDLSRVSRESLIIRKRNAISLDVSKIDCDYYRFLNGDIAAINEYSGEYMSQYWWAEFTSASIMASISR